MFMSRRRSKAAAPGGGDDMAVDTAGCAGGLLPPAARRVSIALREAAAALCPDDPGAADALKRRDGVALAAALSDSAAKLVQSLPPGFLEPLCSRSSLSPGQLEQLAQLNACLCDEYAMRRRMLIHRADCTLASLLTSSRTAAPATGAEARRLIAPEREAMLEEARVTVDDVFTTTKADLAALARKTSGATERHAVATVKRVLIGAVPDRGGRAEEGRTAGGKHGMPAFVPRKTGGEAHGGGQGRGGGRGGRGRGGGRGGGGDKQEAAAVAPADAAPAKPRVAWKAKAAPAAAGAGAAEPGGGGT